MPDRITYTQDLANCAEAVQALVDLTYMMNAVGDD